MSYLITHTTGGLICEVAENTIDILSSPLTLIGKHYEGYGEAFNNNLIRLLENFCAPTAPATSFMGQLWYNQTTGKINLRNTSTSWGPIASEDWTTNNFIMSSNPDGANLWFGAGNQYQFSWQADRNVVLSTFNSSGQAVPIWTTGTLVSDSRLKTDVADLTAGLDTVLKLHPITFKWQPGSGLHDNGILHTGFLAQEFEAQIPDGVSNVGTTKLLHKEEAIPHLVLAIQELHAENEALRERLDALENKPARKAKDKR